MLFNWLLHNLKKGQNKQQHGHQHCFEKQLQERAQANFYRIKTWANLRTSGRVWNLASSIKEQVACENKKEQHKKVRKLFLAKTHPLNCTAYEVINWSGLTIIERKVDYQVKNLQFRWTTISFLLLYKLSLASTGQRLTSIELEFFSSHVRTLANQLDG